MKLLLLIVSIILFVVAAILFVALAVTLKHTVGILAVVSLALGVFAASFLPIPGP